MTIDYTPSKTVQPPSDVEGDIFGFGFRTRPGWGSRRSHVSRGRAGSRTERASSETFLRNALSGYDKGRRVEFK